MSELCNENVSSFSRFYVCYEFNRKSAFGLSCECMSRCFWCSFFLNLWSLWMHSPLCFFHSSPCSFSLLIIKHFTLLSPAAFHTEMRAEHRTGRAPSMTGRRFSMHTFVTMREKLLYVFGFIESAVGNFRVSINNFLCSTCKKNVVLPMNSYY